MAKAHAGTRPLVGLAVCALGGIVADGYWQPENPIAVVLAFVALVAALLAASLRSLRATAGCLCLAVACCFAERHRSQTRFFAADDIGNYATRERQLAEAEGIVDTPIQHRAPRQSTFAPWRGDQNCNFTMRACRLAGRDVSGKLHVIVADRLEGVGRGDRIRVLGMMVQPSPPANPGEFDYRSYLLLRRTRALLHAETASSIRVIEPARWWHARRHIDNFRAACDAQFDRLLPPELATLASALVLGKLRAMPDDELRPFLETGTLHLLVVSGMHVVIASEFLWLLLALVGTSPRISCITMLTAAPCYVALTGGDPPVVRAGIAIAMAAVARATDRRFDPIVALAAAALAISFIDPTAAMRSGVQLSFGAVLIIHMFVEPVTVAIVSFGKPSAHDPTASIGLLTWQSWLMSRTLRMTCATAASSVVVWTLLMPMIALHFRLTSPISILLTPLLGLPVAAAILLGPVAIGLSFIGAWTASPISQLLKLALWPIHWTAHSADCVPLSFGYVAGPTAPWATGFYLILFLPQLFRVRRGVSRPHAAAVVGWLALGMASDMANPQPRGAELHQLAVGHGLATVLRMPDGTTCLYDCGSMRGPEVGERTIAPWLWSKGVQRLHGIIVSHADVDHFAGLESLLRRFAVDAVYVTPQLARSMEPATVEMLGHLAKSNVPVKLYWRGDEFAIGDAIATVLHPAANAKPESDNAASGVLEVRWQRQRWLLTGDLAGSGLAAIIKSTPGGFTVLAAPHHGGRTSNTATFARWADANVVIASDGHRRSKTDPLAVYRSRGVECFDTHEDGWVSCLANETSCRIATYLSQRSIEIAVAASVLPQPSGLRPNGQ